MNTRADKSNLYKLSSVEIYKLVLTRNLFRFSKGFWLRPDAEKNAIEVTKYLLENLLNLTDEQIKETITNEFFGVHRLKGMLHDVFNYSTYKDINTIYPNKFKPWELKCFPQNYSTLEIGIQATKWLIEDVLKLSPHEAILKVNMTVIGKYGLGIVIYRFFGGSYIKAIKTAFPELVRSTTV